jgi:phage protein D
MASTNAFLVEIAGKPLPADVEPLLSSAYVDDSLNLPDVFLLRFRDPDRVVLGKAGITIGAPVRVSVLAGDEQAPELLVAGEVTALEVDVDATGTFTVVRGYDHAHRLFRGRGTYAYTQVTASDVVTTVARRAGLQLGEVAATSTVFDHIAQRGSSDWWFLSELARDIGYEVAVREGKLDFRPPRTASTAPGADPDTNPLVLQLGTDLLRFRAVVTAAEQVTEVQVRGWDVAQKRPLVATAPARTTTAELAGAEPAKLAASFGSPVYVSGEIPYGTQAEVDVAAEALADQVAGAFAEFSGLARGNPALRADVAFTIGGLGSPFDGKYTITSSRHTYDPAGTVRRGRGPGQRRRRSRGAGPGQVGAPAALGRLRHRLGADGAAGSGHRPRDDDGARGRRRGARRVRRCGQALRVRWPLQRRGRAAAGAGRDRRRGLGSGQPAVAGVAPRSPHRSAR